MTNAEIKREIAKRYGFSTRKIVLLESYLDAFGNPSHVTFEVCGITYRSYLADLMDGFYSAKESIRFY